MGHSMVWKRDACRHSAEQNKTLEHFLHGIGALVLHDTRKQDIMYKVVYNSDIYVNTIHYHYYYYFSM